ncbi:hypothetical protein BLIN9172_03560 [Brevibacterium linens ATCC 9172]|uniref:VOC domain-containing protein n=1 Tax=Brevibacterium linens ATCC 9172 TaxID=1255617 RepID=A0A2H1KU88_BRELN|nr:hypothetical protein BLIN9172_03560 [Brevibacterium linens ATCC 9172]
MILWTDDAPVGYARLVALGAKPVKTPEPWLDHLLIASVEDPDGHLVQVVQTLNRPVVEPEHGQTSKRNFTEFRYVATSRDMPFLLFRSALGRGHTTDQSRNPLAYQGCGQEQCDAVDRVTEPQLAAVPLEFTTRHERPGKHDRQSRRNTGRVTTLRA